MSVCVSCLTFPGRRRGSNAGVMDAYAVTVLEEYILPENAINPFPRAPKLTVTILNTMTLKNKITQRPNILFINFLYFQFRTLI